MLVANMDIGTLTHGWVMLDLIDMDRNLITIRVW